jgi:enamine deaminase RidA (YjgF/YER057c/UK114 family)
VARRQTHSSGAPWEASFGYSRAVRVGDVIAVSGTVGRNADGTVPDGAYAQAKRALDIILESLHALGAQRGDVVRTRTFVVDIGVFNEVARAHAEVFGDVRPAT